MSQASPPDERLKRLANLSRSFTYATSLSEILRYAAKQAADLLEAAKAILMLADDEGLLHVHASFGVSDDVVSRFSASFDESLASRLQGLFGGAEGFLGVPLVVQGRVVGLLAVMRKPDAGISDDDEWLLSALADQLAAPLENAHLAAKVQRAAFGQESAFHVRLPLGDVHLNSTRPIEESDAVASSPVDAYAEEVSGWNTDSSRKETTAPSTDDHSHFRVLVADANVETRSAVSGLLAPFAEVHTVSNGADACHALETTSYDLLLADVRMPSMDGFELLRHVRATTALRTLPVVLLSARAGMEARIEGLTAGADDYLVKPFTARDLVTRIVNVASLARARAGLALEKVERQVAERTIELRDAELERQELRRQLAAAEESERRRLARELHDQLGQHLTAFALGLAEVRRLINAGESPEQRLSYLEDLSRSMTRDTRYLALELRPPDLDDVGLESALATYLDEWSARYGVDVEFEVLGAATRSFLPADTGTAIYRIAQEALTNIAKHAQARHVAVLLDRRGPGVRFVVEDNGCGFDYDATVQRAKRDRRFGIAGMRERASLAGGELQVEASRDGTAIYVNFPEQGGIRQLLIWDADLVGSADAMPTDLSRCLNANDPSRR